MITTLYALSLFSLFIVLPLLRKAQKEERPLQLATIGIAARIDLLHRVSRSMVRSCGIARTQ